MAAEAIAFGGSVVLIAALAMRAAASISQAGDGWLALAALVAAVLSADFLSGLLHWFCDTFFEEDSPLIGPFVIHGFREHHRDPKAIVRHGFLEANGSNFFVVLPALAGGAMNGGGAVFADSFVVFLSIAVMATNQLHKWAHADRVPPSVAWLQRNRLVLRPDEHARHHAPPYAGTYCVTTGWLNHVLDPLAFFTRLERLARRRVVR